MVRPIALAVLLAALVGLGAAVYLAVAALLRVEEMGFVRGLVGSRFTGAR